MRVLGTLVASSTLLMIGASSARADVCGCPSVGLFPGTPLTAVLHPTIASDVDQAFDLRVTAYLKVGETSLGQIGSFSARSTQTPIAVDLPVPATLRKHAFDLARRTKQSRARVLFVTTGAAVSRVTFESFISMREPVRTTSTRVALGSFAGDSRPTPRSLLLPTPSWRRTSAPGAKLATFSAIPAGENCKADFLAQASTVATTTPTALLDDIGPGPTYGTASSPWRIVSSPTDAVAPRLNAIGVRRVARNRYAVLRLRVSFRPGCPPSAARTTALVTALRSAARSFKIG